MASLPERRENIVQCLFLSQAPAGLRQVPVKSDTSESYPQPLRGPALLHFHDFAFAQSDAPVHAGCELHIVGRDDSRDAGRSHKLRQCVENVLSSVEIKVTCWLVR